jgi:hypothetical protein
MSDEVYAIVNLKGYVEEMRQAAANSLTENCTDNLDEYISINQMINLVKDHCLGFDGDDRPLLNEDSNVEIFESTVDWIQNVGLAKLAAQDLVECAWDDETNEMVFWSKEKKKNATKRKPRRKNQKDKRSDC